MTLAFRSVSCLLVFLGSLAGQEVPRDSAPAPTFAQDVAPIIHGHCTPCHRPGQAGPFSLITYRDVQKRGSMIARVTESGFMPPWHPVEGHGEFEGALRLSKEELATIARWVETGMAQGDPSRTPSPPPFHDGWYLGAPDLIVKMPRGFEVPAGGPDIYRNFVIPLDSEEERWLDAIEVRPSARSVLHHVIFSLDTTGRSRRRDGQDGQPGWSSMGERSPLEERLGTVSGLGGWAVGGMPRRLPLGLARRLPKGADVVLRSHFHPAGKVETEQTTLGLYFAKEPTKRTMVSLQLPPGFGIAAGLDVPAGDADWKLKDEFTLPVDALALTVGGHAHYICREMQVFVTRPEQKPESIFWIDDWAFNWQNRYQYGEPVLLPAGTKVEGVITYDNSANNPNNPFDPPRRILWGQQSNDEMGSVSLLLVARNNADAKKLEEAVGRHRRVHLRAGMRDRRNMSGLLVSRLRMLDKNGDGKIEGDEIPSRMRRLVRRADTNGDGAVDQSEIEALLERSSGGRRRER